MAAIQMKDIIEVIGIAISLAILVDFWLRQQSQKLKPKKIWGDPRCFIQLISNTHKVNDLTWGETEKMKVKNSHFDGKI